MSKSAEFLKKGDDLFSNRKLDEALEIYIEAADAATVEKNNSNLVEAYSQVARCYLGTKRKEEGREWLARAAELVTDQEAEGWSRYLGVRGRYEWQDAAAEAKAVSPEAPKAAGTFKEMYNFCMANDLFNRAVDAANMMTITGEMEERVEWGIRGIEAAEKGNLESWLAPLWNNLGWNYNDMGRSQESLEALKKARDYHYKKENGLAKLIADWSVGHAYRMVGQLDSASTWMNGVHDWAVKRYDQDSKPENAEWVGFSHRELGEIALTNGDNKKALEHLIRAKEFLSEAGMQEWDAKGFEELIGKIEKIEKKK
jgi:tetratricopeptide (TPR) repeat protein